MNWLKSRIIKCLGLDISAVRVQILINDVVELQRDNESLKKELHGFREALKASAAKPLQIRDVRGYTDYETSQKLALKDFEEKNNGV